MTVICVVACVYPEPAINPLTLVTPLVIIITGGPVYPIPELVTLIAVITPPDTVAVATAPEPPPPIILFVFLKMNN